MATLRDIKLRIGGVKNIAKITQAMKMVAAAKMNRAQSAITSARPYVDKMGQVISNVIATLDDSYSNSLLNKSDSDNHYTVIVVSADKGLCGAFNSNLFKRLLHLLQINKKIIRNLIIK
jgi:F-type H+-transporting ATPase subunit gamma